MFLGTLRDLTRVSTPVAQEPLHLTPARDVTNQRFTGDWKLVDYNRHCHMIVHTSNDLFQRAMGRKEGGGKGTKEDESGRGGEGERGGEGTIEGKIEGKARKGEEGQKRPQSTAAKSQALTVYKPMKKAEVGNPKSCFFSKLFQIFKKSQASQPLDADEPLPSLATTLEFDPNNLKELFSDFLDSLHDDIKASQELGELLMSHSIRIIDSGGQPQFHDIVSIFLSYISIRLPLHLQALGVFRCPRRGGFLQLGRHAHKRALRVSLHTRAGDPPQPAGHPVTGQLRRHRGDAQSRLCGHVSGSAAPLPRDPRPER